MVAHFVQEGDADLGFQVAAAAAGDAHDRAPEELHVVGEAGGHLHAAFRQGHARSAGRGASVVRRSMCIIARVALEEFVLDDQRHLLQQVAEVVAELLDEAVGDLIEAAALVRGQRHLAMPC